MRGFIGQLLAAFYFCVASMLVPSCTTAATTSQDPIIGDWDGVGYLSTFHASFDKNHNYKLSESGFGSKEEIATGTWSLRGGKYALAHAEDARTAVIDSQGQLVLMADVDPNIKMVFRRHGAKPPVSASAGKPPVGEWRYAHTSKSSVPANVPPPFDVFVFARKDSVHLKSTSVGKEFDQACTIKDDIISIRTGAPQMPKMEFRFGWADAGKSLILSIPQAEHGPFEFEWKFIRPDEFLPCDINATWTGKIVMTDMSEQVTFEKDGKFNRTVLSRDGKPVHKNNARVSDYYRLWKSPSGNALTIVTFDPEMGAQMSQMFQYERKGNELKLIPLELQEDGKLKPHTEATVTWKLKP